MQTADFLPQHSFECAAKVNDSCELSKYYNIVRSKYCLIPAIFFAFFSKSFQQFCFLRVSPLCCGCIQTQFRKKNEASKRKPIFKTLRNMAVFRDLTVRNGLAPNIALNNL